MRWYAIAVVLVLAACGSGPASLVVTPAGKTFGSVGVGATGEDIAFTVENLGDSATGALVVTVDDPQFQIASSTCTGPLAGHASCAVVAHFAPTRRGAIAARLAIAGLPGELASVALSGTGLAPAALAIAPGSHDFGAQIWSSSSAPFAFAIKNTGEVPSSAIVPMIGGAAASDYTVGSDCATLAPGGSCTATVVFRSQELGCRLAATLMVDTASASVVGDSIGPGGLMIAPSHKDFGNVGLGTTSLPTTITITNTGCATTGALTVTPAGSDPSQFLLGTNTCGTPLAPGATCAIAVSFAPTAAGIATASFDVTANPGGNVSVALTGTGMVTTSLGASPASKDFGYLAPGPGMPATFTITNLGAGTIGAVTVALGGADASSFQLGASTCSAPLAPGATCTVDVAPDPMAPGSHAAVLTVSTAGGSVDVPLSLGCCAPPQLAISPTMHDFGSQTVGTVGTAYAFTVTNDAAATTGPITVAVAGIAPSEFQIASNTCGAPLANLASCTISIAFAPTSSGARSASLVVTANPGGMHTAGLSGTGL